MMNLISLGLLLLAATMTSAGGADGTQMQSVEFNVKPGGEVYTFSSRIKDHECTFTYSAQGGTNEQWMISVGISDDEQYFSCSVFSPRGKSYLFFTQFQADLDDVPLEYANAYAQTAAAGSEVPLKPEEFTVGETVVKSNDGKFKSALSSLHMIGRIMEKDEL